MRCSAAPTAASVGVVEVAVARASKPTRRSSRASRPRLMSTTNRGSRNGAGRRRPTGRDVERLEHGIHGEAVAARRAVGEPDRLAVDEDEIDLGVRDAGRLDDVLHRLVAAERPPHRRPARCRREEVVQLGVGAHVDVTGRHQRSRSSTANAP